MARTISTVTAIFGTAERKRSIYDGVLTTMGGQRRGRRLAPARGLNSGLEGFDLVPQRTVLGLVDRPDLGLRDFAEFLDLGFHHRHAEWLQLRLGLGEIVDRLGRLADLLLRGARQVHDQLLLVGGETVPYLEIHHRVGRA